MDVRDVEDPTPDRPGGRWLPTLEQVAAASGVSRSTVSRVVNGSPKVRPQVVEVVNEAIARLNYVPNRAARSLVSRQTYAIALLVPEDVARFFVDPFFASIVEGITARLESTEYVLNLLVASADPSRKTRRYLRSGAVDGALVVSHHAGDRDLGDLTATTPVVFGGRPVVADPRTAYYVDVDNVTGGWQATEHLVRRGRRTIGLITGPHDMPASEDRLAGWRRALVDAGLPTGAVAAGDFTRGGGAQAMRDLLARHPDLDAVFVESDMMARGALAALAEAGRSVPDDVAVVGFDDSPLATSEHPALTTVWQPSAGMGAAMADMLLELVSGGQPEPRARLLRTELVVRQTS